jgi:geranylgeranyl pyrophosphate synthase
MPKQKPLTPADRAFHLRMRLRTALQMQELTKVLPEADALEMLQEAHDVICDLMDRRNLVRDLMTMEDSLADTLERHATA